MARPLRIEFAHAVYHVTSRGTAILVEKEPHLLELCRYVVLNPVRAKMVKQPVGWPWSSYRATAGERLAPGWLTTDWVLGERRKSMLVGSADGEQFDGKADGLCFTSQPTICGEC